MTEKPCSAVLLILQVRLGNVHFFRPQPPRRLFCQLNLEKKRLMVNLKSTKRNDSGVWLDLKGKHN